MSAKVITITGGSGFIGQMLQAGLSERGYTVRVFDRYRSALVRLLRRRYLGTAKGSLAARFAYLIHQAQRGLEPFLTQRGMLRPTSDDILAMRSVMTERFKGSYAVIHLAGISHPFAPGSIPEDFRRINYDGSVNVFEAARAAGAAKFVFGSSAQVYKINDPVRIDQFPILESNYLPGLEEQQSMYGFLKAEVERYLAQNCCQGKTQAISLRMEYPGFRSVTPDNLYISTSIENLLQGFVAALETRSDFAFEAFNLADAHVDTAIVDVQSFLRARWPEVPNYTRNNDALLSTEKAQRVLGYCPINSGRYYDTSVVW